jgi:hypothetical protein
MGAGGVPIARQQLKRHVFMRGFFNSNNNFLKIY